MARANWTFVVWGGLNGLYTAVSILVSGATGRRFVPVVRLPSAAGLVIGRLLTFHLILVTWVFFRAASLSDALTIMSRLSGALTALPLLLLNRVAAGEIVVSLILIATLLGVEALDEVQPVWQRLQARPVYVRWTAYCGLLLCLIVLGAWNPPAVRVHAVLSTPDRRWL